MFVITSPGDGHQDGGEGHGKEGHDRLPFMELVFPQPLRFVEEKQGDKSEGGEGHCLELEMSK